MPRTALGGTREEAKVIAKVSGEAVRVSGETVSLPADQVVKVSGETVISKVSGETVSLPATQAVKVSGEKLFAITESGDYVVVSGTVIAKVSGEFVYTSVDVTAYVSGQPVKISGETISIQTPTEVKTGPIRNITAASGGEVLHSGAVLSVNVKSLSGDIYIGGATNLPYSGFGFLLAAGEANSLDVDDFNRVYLCATTSGDPVTFLGIK